MAGPWVRIGARRWSTLFAARVADPVAADLRPADLRDKFYCEHSRIRIAVPARRARARGAPWARSRVIPSDNAGSAGERTIKNIYSESKPRSNGRISVVADGLDGPSLRLWIMLPPRTSGSPLLWNSHGGSGPRID